MMSAAVLLVACNSAPKAPPRANSIPAKVEQLGEMSYLSITNLTAQKRNRLLFVQAEVTNHDIDNQQMFYRFKWLDANGFVVGDDEAWQPLAMYSYQKQTINGVAPSPQATDFRLMVSSSENTGEKP